MINKQCEVTLLFVNLSEIMSGWQNLRFFYTWYCRSLHIWTLITDCWKEGWWDTFRCACFWMYYTMCSYTTVCPMARIFLAGPMQGPLAFRFTWYWIHDTCCLFWTTVPHTRIIFTRFTTICARCHIRNTTIASYSVTGIMLTLFLGFIQEFWSTKKELRI